MVILRAKNVLPELYGVSFIYSGNRLHDEHTSGGTYETRNGTERNQLGRALVKIIL